MKKNVLGSVICLLSLSSFAQVNQYQITHDLGAGDYGNAIIANPTTGNHIIVGSTNSNSGGSYDVLLTFSDQEGALSEFGGQIGGSNAENARSVAIDPSGNLLIGANSSSFSTSPAGLSDFFPIVLDENRDLVWMRSWGTDSVDVAQKIISADDGNIMVAGKTNRRNGQRTDILIAKLDALTGDTIWAREIGNPFINETLFDFYSAGAGFGLYLITGSSGANVIGLNDALVIMINDDGGILVSFVVGGPGDDDARTVLTGGGFKSLVAGNTRGIGAGGGDAFLAKFDGRVSPPTLDWFITYGGAGDESLQSAIRTADGNILMTGTTNSFGNGQEGFVMKVDTSSGEIQWSNVYGGTGNDYLMDLTENADGSFTAVGYSNSFGATTDDLWLVGFDALGNSSCSQTAVTFTRETIDPEVAYLSALQDITSTPVTLIDRVAEPSFGENTTVQNTLCLATAIDEKPEESNHLMLFPTPTSDQLNINLPEKGMYRLNLYAMDGRMVSSTTYSGTTAQIAVGTLPSGIYMLEVKGETKAWKSKVVKN